MFKKFLKNFKNYIEYLMTVNFKELFVNVAILFCIIVLASFMFIPIDMVQELFRSLINLLNNLIKFTVYMWRVVTILDSTAPGIGIKCLHEKITNNT